MTARAHRLPIPGGALALVLHLPEDLPALCVVACHGLNTSKDGEKFRLLAEQAPRAGLAVARFDFRGCGESSGVEEETTIASRLDDVETVVAFLDAQPELDGRFGFLGSSLGGFVALHVAARRLTRGLGTPVVTWNAPASLTELANDDLPEGRGLGVPFALEYTTGRYALAPPGLSHHLIVHGEADEVVDLEHAMALHERALEPVDLVLIPGGDHRLSDPTHRARAVAVAIDWFTKWL